MESDEEIPTAPSNDLLTISFRREPQAVSPRPLLQTQQESEETASEAATDSTQIDLWDDCIVPPPPQNVLPSSDQQDYAHDLGLVSVSGENNVTSNPPSHISGGQSDSTLLTASSFWTRSMSFDLLQDAFCDCHTRKKVGPVPNNCVCGEDDTDFNWLWDPNAKSWATQLQEDNREVRFHKHYSSGTAAIRGSKSLTSGQHYWEIKMISPVYGTDMMIGIGTIEADLNKNSTNFCSLLGSDSESWGLSYTGLFHHNGKPRNYTQRFAQGSIIGVHLDMWNGTLAFYNNRRPLGIACSGLKGKKLYPMVSSTAARSAMKMVCSRSFNSLLQYFCCLTLRKMVSSESSVLESIKMPPGLKNFLNNNLSWILGPVEPFNKCCVNYEHCYCLPRKKSRQSTCPLFSVDKSKVPKTDCEAGTSQPSTYPSQHCRCYHHGTNLSKRRKHTSEKQRLLLSVLSLPSSDESDDSDNEIKRKH